MAKSYKWIARLWIAVATAWAFVFAAVFNPWFNLGWIAATLGWIYCAFKWYKADKAWRKELAAWRDDLNA